MLSVKNLVKIYKQKKAEPVRALDGVSIDFADTGLVFLLGKSGSGKSTLLNAIGGLDVFDEGEIIIKGKSSKEFSQSDFDSYRNTFIGFIFQEYNILENFSVEKNLALAIELQGKKPNKQEIHELLEQVDMVQYAKRKPNQLSGGQKQRVAIARALIKHPEIIMADEPTGALDSNTGKQVMETLKKLSKEKLVIIVSHDREFAEFYGDRIIELKDGKIISDVTKKEIEAQETSSGMKIIDNNILYIKKGQQISQDEMKKLIVMINEQSKENDTFISFDEKANAELKKGASINDEGNREKFEQTQTEDVKLKQYNPNSLKLIKSRLKFSDSLKMGASSLKNKVGKLIFTIILSFLAFTVFGVVDALSCWNRGESVYQAMEMTGQKNVVMKGMKKGIGMMAMPSNAAITQSDLDDLNEKFPEYVVKPVIGVSYGYLYLNEYSLSETRNPLYQNAISGMVSFSEEEFNKMEFEFVGSNSRLPEKKDEVCISKQMFKSIVKRAEKDGDNSRIENFEQFTDAKPLLISNGDFKINLDGVNNYDGSLRVVGVIDDKTDISKYENMNQDDLANDWQLEEYLNSTLIRFLYVHPEAYEELLNDSYVDQYYYGYIGGKTNDYMWTQKDYFYGVNERMNYHIYNEEYNLSENHKWLRWDGWGYQKRSEADVIKEYGSNYQPYQEIDEAQRKIIYQNNITYVKGGFDSRFENGKFKLGKNEILVSESYLNARFEDWQSKIDDGLKFQFCTEYEKLDTSILDLTIVGVFNNGNENEIIMADGDKKSLLDKLYGGYQMAVTRLNGTSTDAEFIQYLETWNERGFRMSVQNSSTAMLDMMEEILVMMTSVFVWVAVGFAVFAALLLMNFISTSINYKKREIGVLRALGARGSDIFGIFFNESSIIALINFALATIATFVGCGVINSIVISKLGLEIALLNVGIRQMLLILAVSWGSAFLSSLLPSLKISRKKPIDAINNR